MVTLPGEFPVTAPDDGLTLATWELLLAQSQE
jgi:hypothetical protein